MHLNPFIIHMKRYACSKMCLEKKTIYCYINRDRVKLNVPSKLQIFLYCCFLELLFECASKAISFKKKSPFQTSNLKFAWAILFFWPITAIFFFFLSADGILVIFFYCPVNQKILSKDIKIHFWAYCQVHRLDD